MNNNFLFTLWLTGLSGSGKTTIAVKLSEKLKARGHAVHHLDGDEVRAFSKERLGFSKEDRDKNIRLAITLAQKYNAEGKSVIASFISPYKEHREWGRDNLANFIEVFVDAPLLVCESRDPKGLYKKARSGEVGLFTGISDPYDIPNQPDIHIKTDKLSLDECVDIITSYLARMGLVV